MCFTDTHRAREEHPSLLRRILFHKPAGIELGFGETVLVFIVLVALECAEIAVLVARRNPRRRQQTFAAALQPALAAHHFALFTAHDAAPSGVITDRAR